MDGSPCWNCRKEKPSQTKKRPVGRPKGSQNKKKEPSILSPELLRIQPILQAFLAVLKGGDRAALCHKVADAK